MIGPIARSNSCPASGLERLVGAGRQRTRATYAVPSGQAPCDVPRIEATFPQGRRDATADVKTVRAVDRDGLVRREFPHPRVDLFWIVPDCSLHHVCSLGEVVTRPRVHDLDGFTS